MTTITTNGLELAVRLRRPHKMQQAFIDSLSPRKIIRAGRRSGKTTGVAILAIKAFLAGKRVLYAAPVADQIERFWVEVRRALWDAVEAGVLYKNETLHVVELPNSEQRIRAKTAWNADTLRGDYADLLILDEWQLMDEQAWELVGAPMLLDNNGAAAFVYTPPSVRSRSISKARDPRHAAKMFKAALGDTTGRWAAFHFTSHDNPHISTQALTDMQDDMTALAYRQEIMAEEVEEVPGALWTQAGLDRWRIAAAPDMARVVVGIDPAGGGQEGADETGIIVAGKGVDANYYVLGDASCRLSPHGWATRAISAYRHHQADRIVAEENFGGQMVEHTLRIVEPNISYKAVHATRGKRVRAEPVAALYEQGRVHHVGTFPELEEQLYTWVPDSYDHSPDRMDALVWALTDLMGGGPPMVRWV